MLKNLFIFVVALYCCNNLRAQNVFSPADAIVTYKSSAAAGSPANPTIPANGVMAKWVRTQRVGWTTTNYKAYIWNNMAFRLRFPNNYNPANASKYPVIVFFHGGGEIGGVYDNEDQLVWAAQPFEQRINNGEWNGFMLFPQETSVGWDDNYFGRINGVLDTLQKYNNSDPDRVISMGLSSGGYGAVNYASIYPKRVAACLPSSPASIRTLDGGIPNFIHIPLWMANGGVDVNPDPYSAQAFYFSFRNAGGNMYQTYYVNDAHNTWTDMWNQKNAAGAYITSTYWNSAHKAQPLVYFQNQQFCDSKPIAARMGITAGYAGYEWQLNNATIAGANGNEYTATQAGQYRVRFLRTAGGTWSAWTPNPVVISTKTCTTDTLYAEHFTRDNYYVAEAEYKIGTISCQNGIMTSGTDQFTQDATGVQGNRFLIHYTSGASGCTYAAGDRVWNTYGAVTVTPNTNYEYSFYLGNQTATNPAQIAPTINGTALIAGSVQATGVGNASWKKYTYTWNSGGFTWADLGLINRSIATNGNDFAIDEISFKLASALPVPGCTSNTLPANAATLTTNATATLTWAAAANAASYDVYLWTGATAPTIPVTSVTTTSYNAVGLTGSTQYKWYVVPKNASGVAASGCIANQTTFTTAVTPATPACVTNTSPANGSTIAGTTTATLTWTAAATATSYDVYLWTGATAPTTATANVAGTTYNASALTSSSLYNWYVVPKNAAGASTGCNTNATNFTTATIPTAPVCVTNMAPANGSTIATITTATLNWNAASGATSYDVYLWTGATIPVTPTVNVTATTYSATALTASTVYSYYVVPKNAVGSPSGCSSNKTTFTTAALPTAPLCVTNTSPANGSTIATTTTATLSWNAAATATSYDVYLWTGATEPVAATANVTTASYSATGLTASSLYNWYVVPKNAIGSSSGCSSNKTNFTTAALPTAPLCVTNTSPANGTIIATTNSATLTWNAAPTATSYDVYLWTGATAPTTATATVATTSYSATALVAASVYNWYVVPKNAVGSSVGCNSNTTSFTTATPPLVGGGVGLQGDYYNTMDLSGPIVLTRTDATVGFDWVYGSPSPLIHTDIFSARWTGQVQPLYSQTYTFYTYSDDGVRLWVNGVLLVDNWTNHPPQTNSGTITLVANMKYDIRMEYFENSGGASAQLSWSSASTPKAIIPQSQLFLPVSANRVANVQAVAAVATNTVAAVVSNIESNVFPNPAVSGQNTTLQISSDKGGVAAVQVLSAMGNVVQAEQLSVAPGNNTRTLHTAGLRPGLYIIHVAGNVNKITTLKLVVH